MPFLGLARLQRSLTRGAVGLCISAAACGRIGYDLAERPGTTTPETGAIGGAASTGVGAGAAGAVAGIEGGAGESRGSTRPRAGMVGEARAGATLAARGVGVAGAPTTGGTGGAAGIGRNRRRRDHRVLRKGRCPRVGSAVPRGMFMMGSPTSEPTRNPQRRSAPGRDHAAFLVESDRRKRNRSGNRRWGATRRISATAVRRVRSKRSPGSRPSPTRTCSRCATRSTPATEPRPERCTTWPRPTRARRPSGALASPARGTGCPPSPSGSTPRAPERAPRSGRGRFTATRSGCSREPSLDSIAWYCNNSNAAKTVRSKGPNPWGFYDMNGNVWEWVWDYDGTYPAVAIDPIGPASGTRHVERGGSYFTLASDCRSAERLSDPPGTTHPDLGLRIARSLP